MVTLDLKTLSRRVSPEALYMYTELSIHEVNESSSVQILKYDAYE